MKELKTNKLYVNYMNKLYKFGFNDFMNYDDISDILKKFNIKYETEKVKLCYINFFLYLTFLYTDSNLNFFYYMLIQVLFL